MAQVLEEEKVGTKAWPWLTFGLACAVVSAACVWIPIHIIRPFHPQDADGVDRGAAGSSRGAVARRFVCGVGGGVDDLVVEESFGKSPADLVSGRDGLSMRCGDCGSVPDPCEYLREDVSSLRRAGIWERGQSTGRSG